MPTNEARALLLLEANGIITLKEDAGLNATANDIAENPHNVKIVEMEAAQIARAVEDADFVVLNGNYALQANFSVEKDALAKKKQIPKQLRLMQISLQFVKATKKDQKLRL